MKRLLRGVFTKAIIALLPIDKIVKKTTTNKYQTDDVLLELAYALKDENCDALVESSKKLKAAIDADVAYITGKLSKKK